MDISHFEAKVALGAAMKALSDKTPWPCYGPNPCPSVNNEPASIDCEAA